MSFRQKSPRKQELGFPQKEEILSFHVQDGPGITPRPGRTYRIDLTGRHSSAGVTLRVSESVLSDTPGFGTKLSLTDSTDMSRAPGRPPSLYRLYPNGELIQCPKTGVPRTETVFSGDLTLLPTDSSLGSDPSRKTVTESIRLVCDPVSRPWSTYPVRSVHLKNINLGVTEGRVSKPPSNQVSASFSS